MAFLCPVRIKRNKKKKNSEEGPSMGRITGSASIETLVRVGIEKENGLGPESKMVVLHDFTPCVDDEVEVKRGQIVHVLYQENDWVYVISEESKEGFIPHSYCTPYGSTLANLALNVKKKIPRQNNCAKELVSSKYEAEMSVPCRMESTIRPFVKDSPGASYLALYTYLAQDENDVNIEQGQIVTLLNSEDPDWRWIRRKDGSEGFVPSGFIYPLDASQRFREKTEGKDLSCIRRSPILTLLKNAPPPPPGAPNNGDIRYNGSQLLMLYDYKAQAPDDLTVRRGDTVFADLNKQSVDGWLWTYAPSSRKYGFIPKAYARHPAMTSL